MELKVLEAKLPEQCSVWEVEACGWNRYRSDKIYKGHIASAENREVVYRGGDAVLAKRAFLEVMALSKVYPDGRAVSEEYCYAKLAKMVLAGVKKSNAKGMPFAWALEGWSKDLTLPGVEFDATLHRAEMFWVDQAGRRCEVEVELGPKEKTLLSAIPRAANGNKGRELKGLLSIFEAWELGESVKQAPSSKASPSL